MDSRKKKMEKTYLEFLQKMNVLIEKKMELIKVFRRRLELRKAEKIEAQINQMK